MAEYGFKLDLRRAVGREVGKLTPAQRAAIRRTHDRMRELGVGQTANAQVVKPRRNPGESKRAYTARVRTIKAQAGQAGSPLTGPVLNVPRGARVDFRTGEVRMTDAERTFEERIVPVDRAAAAADPGGYARELAESLAADGWSTIQPLYGIHRMRQFALFDDLDIDEFEGFIDDHGDRYELAAFWGAVLVTRGL